MLKGYILVATNTEYGLIKKYKSNHSEEMKNYSIVKTGVGRTNVMIALSKIAQKINSKNKPAIINIGLCGSNVKNSNIYDIIEPENFMDIDRDWSNPFVEPDMYPMTTQNSGPTLISGSRFIKNSSLEAFFDMEAFDIHAFCKTFGLKFFCFKIVSDFCSQTEYEKTTPERLYMQFEKALTGCFKANNFSD